MIVCDMEVCVSSVLDRVAEGLRWRSMAGFSGIFREKMPCEKFVSLDSSDSQWLHSRIMNNISHKHGVRTRELAYSSLYAGKRPKSEDHSLHTWRESVAVVNRKS